jgi:pimeloyl-ACP methyl ester carboxylesterase
MFASADAAIARLERGQRVDPASIPAPLASLFTPSVQPYLMDLMAYDPAALAARTKVPMVIVQGETDIQVGVGDARLLAAARPGAKLVLIPGINHLWRKAPADPAANAATYRNVRIPVDPRVAAAIAGFVTAER